MGLTLHTNLSTITSLNTVDPAIWYLVKELYALGNTLHDMQLALDDIRTQHVFATHEVYNITIEARTYTEIDIQFELDAVLQIRQTAPSNLYKFKKPITTLYIYLNALYLHDNYSKISATNYIATLDHCINTYMIHVRISA